MDPKFSLKPKTTELFPIKLSLTFNYRIINPEPKKWWILWYEPYTYSHRAYVRDVPYYLWESPLDVKKIRIPSLFEFCEDNISLCGVSFNVEDQIYESYIIIDSYYNDALICRTSKNEFEKQLDEKLKALGWSHKCEI